MKIDNIAKHTERGDIFFISTESKNERKNASAIAPAFF